MRINTNIVSSLKALGVNYVALATAVKGLVEAGQLDGSKSGEKYTLKESKAKGLQFASSIKDVRITGLYSNTTKASMAAAHFAVWHTLYEAMAKPYGASIGIRLPETLEALLVIHYPYTKPEVSETKEAVTTEHIS